MVEQVPPAAVRVDIVSDVVCPWCVVGYKQFEAALASHPNPPPVSVRWHPFELNPGLAEEGQNLREHLAQKAGITREQSEAARQRLTTLGDELGFAFRFSDEMRIRNTFRAHQLLHWAAAQERQTDLKLALFSAYFTAGENISDPLVLARLAEQVGLDAAEAAEVLADDRFADAVREGERHWQARDIRGVPAFIFNDRYAVLGAQGVDAFQQVLVKLREAA